MRAIRRKVIRKMPRSVCACHRCTTRIKTAARYPCRWGPWDDWFEGWSLALQWCSFSDSILFIIISERTQKRDAKTRIKGKKFVQYLVKVNCETDFPVMLFLAVAKGNVVRAVFCFRLFESALTQVCFKAYFVQPALSPPLLYARGFITVIHAAQP